MFKTAVAPGAAAAVQSVLESGLLGEGPKVQEFTRLLEKHFNSSRVIPLNSCTSALELALRLFNVGPGDTVLSTPFTMVATSCAIAATGADIRWYDPALTTLSVDYPLRLPSLDRVDALMITLVGGMFPPAWVMSGIHMDCKLRGIPLILDCAHVFSTFYENGVRITDYCDAACFSFQAIKHLNCGGDGGAILLNAQLPDHVAERAERLKWFGMTRVVPPGKTRLEHQMTADITEFGYKWHMNDVAASIGVANFLLAAENASRAANNADFYQNAFKDLGGQLQVLGPANKTHCSWWIYGFLATRRQELMDHLTAKGITCTPMWKRNDFYSAATKSFHQLTNMDRITSEVLFIPNGWWVTKEQRQYIVDAVLEFYR